KNASNAILSRVFSSENHIYWPKLRYNVVGRRQAEVLGQWFSAQSMAAIWSSDLPRAMQTAQAIAAHQSCAITATPELRERDLGAFEGKTWNEVRAIKADLTCNNANNGDLADWTGIPGVESDQQLWQRIRKTLDFMADTYRGKNVLAVTHGGVLKHVVWHILGLPAVAPRRFTLANGLTVVLEKRGADFYLLSLLDIELLMGRAASADTAAASA
ncbi:MAG: histidine phosphatase family protein, partial [Phycisphaerae bacterium]